jgi:RHS repeat-associated protein
VEIEFFDGLGRPIQLQILDEGGQYVVHDTRYVEPTGGSRAVQHRVPIRESTSGNYASALVWSGPTVLAPLVEDEPQPLPSMFQNYTETRFVRDGTGRVQGMTFPNEGVVPIAQTFASYDVTLLAGRPVRVSSAFDESSDRSDTWTDGWGHDVRHRRRLTASTSELGLITETDYDVGGRPLAVRPPNYFTPPHGTPDNWVSTSRWDTRGRLTRRTSPDAGELLRAYDAAGHVRFEQDANRRAAAEFVAIRYDALGRPVRSGIYALSSASVTAFSQLDPTRPYAESPWENDATRWVEVASYDQRPSATTAPWSAFSAQVGAFQATFPRGRPVAGAYRSDGAWQVALSAYDAEQRLVRRLVHTQDATNGPALAAYDAEHRYGYDRQGRVWTREVRLGSAGTWFRHWYDYSIRGLPSRIFAGTSPGRPATPDVTWTHTEWGRVASQRNGTATAIPYVYDVRERTVRIGGGVTTAPPTHAFQAEYLYAPDSDVVQSAFLQRHVGAPDSRDYWAYCYDDLDRLRFAANVPGGLPDVNGQCDEAWGVTPDTPYSIASLAYDANGNIQQLARLGATGAVVDGLSYTYVAGTNRLAFITDIGAGASLPWDLESGPVGHDANGNVTQLPAPYTLTAATYDRHNRLLTATSDGSQLRYRYGASDARYMERVRAGTQSVGAMQTVPGRVARMPRPSVVEGERDSDPRVEGVDEGSGRSPATDDGVRRVFAPRFVSTGSPGMGAAGGEEVTFSAIDAVGLGRPAAVREPGGTVTFNLLAPNGDVVGRQPASGGRLYYLRDNLGSVRAVVDAAGAVVESRAYDAWGVALAGRTSGQFSTAQGFTGKQRDAAAGGQLGGLDDFGARSYSPLVGRFLQVDPSESDYPAWSPYVYTFNRPVSLVDPDGRAPSSLVVSSAIGSARNPPWDIVVVMPRDRSRMAEVFVLDRNGNVVDRFYALGRGSSRDPMRTAADSPLGIGRITGWQAGGSRRAYGPGQRLAFESVSGEMEESGRTDLRVHGGALGAEGRLRSTHGCTRMCNTDMGVLYRSTQRLEAADDKEAAGHIVFISEAVSDRAREGVIPSKLRDSVEMVRSLYDTRANNGSHHGHDRSNDY